MLKYTELGAKIILRVTIYLVNIIVRRAMASKYPATVQSKRRFTLYTHKLTAKLPFQTTFGLFVCLFFFINVIIVN